MDFWMRNVDVIILIISAIFFTLLWLLIVCQASQMCSFRNESNDESSYLIMAEHRPNTNTVMNNNHNYNRVLEEYHSKSWELDRPPDYETTVREENRWAEASSRMEGGTTKTTSIYVPPFPTKPFPVAPACAIDGCEK
ncbi:uncharacterized protein LOC143231901 [Tachypleus tridentatus]|uniref:uncharacterized protein LOC143231901 n=1 Tax=Tachypleus tridentatus TaxID=6853 RepID=UPI003FD2B0E7